MEKKDFKKVHESIDTVIFEEGYWMEKGDYDFYMKHKDTRGLALDSDPRTRKITYFFLPEHMVFDSSSNPL